MPAFTFPSFSGKDYVGPNDIFASPSNIRSTLAGEWPPEKLVHVVEKVQCHVHGRGVAIRVSSSFIVGNNQFLVCGDGVQAKELPKFEDLSIDMSRRRMGTFQEMLLVAPRRSPRSVAFRRVPHFPPPPPMSPSSPSGGSASTAHFLWAR
ncbi:hypothetical protein RHGRI_022809 [Rhododendron griersonianum]|uniref:Uncharacterized protein n=1 Tax=Rhododendron griersonianum TaxID=479676 RepID=A0AAV6J833_9ERIC|nr:hypothetical protein RHGRI_022809 [Rhododendron griersonianum]